MFCLCEGVEYHFSLPILVRLSFSHRDNFEFSSLEALSWQHYDC